MLRMQQNIFLDLILNEFNFKYCFLGKFWLSLNWFWNVILSWYKENVLILPRVQLTDKCWFKTKFWAVIMIIVVGGSPLHYRLVDNIKFWAFTEGLSFFGNSSDNLWQSSHCAKCFSCSGLSLVFICCNFHQILALPNQLLKIDPPKFEKTVSCKKKRKEK